MRASLLSLLLLLGLAACERFGPALPLPAGAVVVVRPPQYQLWWEATEACSGLRGSLGAVTWLVVPGATTFSTPDGELVGRWTRDAGGSRVVLAEAWAANEMVVRHEMLHALLDRGGHPTAYFVERCQLTWDTWSGIPPG